MYDIIIVGAGLTGLRIAQKLSQTDVKFLLIEAKPSIGGRIQSDYSTADDDYFDLGPTWFWPDFEPNMNQLLSELNLESFEQFSDGAHTFENPHGMIQHFNTDMPASNRITGGMRSLVKALQKQIPSEKYMLIVQLEQVNQQGDDEIEIIAVNNENREVSFITRSVVLAMPPNTIHENINFTPELSPVTQQKLSIKRTWMASQAKIVVIYDRPFWRDNNLSGTANSYRGPLQEIHDASPKNSGTGALFGFFGLTPGDRKELGEQKIYKLVIAQLTRLFGEEAGNYKDILYKDWSEDAFTAVEKDFIPMTEFPPYQSIDNDEIWGERLLFASTETSAVAGGHLEGALNAANHILNKIT